MLAAADNAGCRSYVEPGQGARAEEACSGLSTSGDVPSHSATHPLSLSHRLIFLFVFVSLLAASWRVTSPQRCVVALPASADSQVA